ncbi:hypothetical protein QL285_064827 [Trifolium repens]|jgi:hypothetical protein|nr:hypothetical protein QL285_064827 [Trifolium repens]
MNSTTSNLHKHAQVSQIYLHKHYPCDKCVTIIGVTPSTSNWTNDCASPMVPNQYYQKPEAPLVNHSPIKNTSIPLVLANSIAIIKASNFT